MKLPHKTIERNLFKSGYQLIYAVDEVGVGCLAGPVVSCAVAIMNTFYNKHHKKLGRIRDSKLVRPGEREKLSVELLKEKDLAYAISLCSPKIIDKINIYNAARKAMRKAINKISNYQLSVSNKFSNTHFSKLKTDKLMETGNRELKTIVLVDGPYKIAGLKIEQQAIVKGDRKVFAIACASIIAKVYRDKLMTNLAKKYPGYGFERHKGYGTKHHQAQLAALGPCEIHRRSFRLQY